MKKRKAHRRKRALGTTIGIIAVVLVLFGVLALFACSEKLKVTHYDLESAKISDTVKIAQISDLHDCLYGENQSEIINALDEFSPDFVVFTGDIADYRWDDENAYLLAREVSKKYKAFYVVGNHENAYKGSISIICNKFADCGLTVLRGDGEKITVGNTEILVCGIDDPLCSPDYNLRMWENELDDCNEMIEDGIYSILLTHRPECVSDYAATDFDLVFAGHAHGGQVRIPLILENGLYAPQQGFFPKYTKGVYELSDKTSMVVSTGLSTTLKPRVFNRPEIVTVTLSPKE